MIPIIIVSENDWKPTLESVGDYSLPDDYTGKEKYIIYNDEKYLTNDFISELEKHPKVICVRFYRGPKEKELDNFWDSLTQDNSLFSMFTTDGPCLKDCYTINGKSIADKDFYANLEKVLEGKEEKFEPDYTNQYNPETFTWGCELEWGDIPRYIDPPKELGKWENSETEVLNLREPHKYVAADPIGENPPFGGEINVRPTKSWQSQVENILKIKEFYADKGFEPTVSCMQGMHIHVHVPGLIEDVQALKNFTWFVKQTQSKLIEKLHGFEKHPAMVGGAARVLNTCATPMPDWKCDNLFKSLDFEDFILIQCCGKDGVSRARPFRYAVNTYNLKHIQTIEYRVPRATLSPEQISDVFEFLYEYTVAALNGGSFEEILSKKDWNISTFKYVPEEYEGWNKTKYPKERGIKERNFIPPEEL